jgi:hypothetical protein
MSTIYATTVDYLFQADVRDRFEVAYNPGLNEDDGHLVVSIDNVRTYPDSVKWLKVEALERRFGTAVVTVDGVRFESGLSYPIVLREAS